MVLDKYNDCDYLIWQVGALPKGALVEVEVVAVSGQLDTTYVTEE